MPDSRLRLLPGPKDAPKRIPNGTRIFLTNPLPSTAQESIRVLDLFGELPVRQHMGCSFGEVWAALASDWETVGRDFWNGMVTYENDIDVEFLKLEEPADVK